jgi:hypothetical protein
MKIDDDHITWESTGRQECINKGIVGISPSLNIYEGYDGCIPNWMNPFTPEERKELADYMVDLWRKWEKE